MIELLNDKLTFRFPEVHQKAECHIDFQRTLRIPDDNRGACTITDATSMSNTGSRMRTNIHQDSELDAHIYALNEDGKIEPLTINIPSWLQGSCQHQHQAFFLFNNRKMRKLFMATHGHYHAK
jgi:hypothetical protein